MSGLKNSTRALLRNDLRQLARDPVMLAAALVPIVLAILLCFALPELERSVVELRAHRSTVVAGTLAITAMLAGWIVGFLLLEERAQRMIPALAVTPLTRRGFVIWRLLSPTLLALLGGVLVVSLGTAGEIPLGRALIGSVLMALTAPLFALALVSVADNEVEGLALAKIGGLAFMLPLLTPYVDSPWIALAAVLPPFWPVQLIVGESWWTVLGALIVSALWAALLLRRLGARMD